MTEYYVVRLKQTEVSEYEDIAESQNNTLFLTEEEALQDLIDELPFHIRSLIILGSPLDEEKQCYLKNFPELCRELEEAAKNAGEPLRESEYTWETYFKYFPVKTKRDILDLCSCFQPGTSSFSVFHEVITEKFVFNPPAKPTA